MEDRHRRRQRQEGPDEVVADDTRLGQQARINGEVVARPVERLGMEHEMASIERERQRDPEQIECLEQPALARRRLEAEAEPFDDEGIGDDQRTGLLAEHRKQAEQPHAT